MKWLSRITTDLRHGDNWEYYIIIPAAFIIGLASLFGVGQNYILSLTLALLALLAGGMLGSRHQVEELVEKMEKTVSGVFLDKFPATLDQDFAAGREVWMVGVTLSTRLDDYPLLEKKVQQGHTLYVLLLTPDSAAVEMAEMRAYARADVQRTKRTINDHLGDFCALHAIAPGRVHIRTIAHPLVHGLVAIDPDTPKGVLYISNYPFRTEGGALPQHEQLHKALLASFDKTGLRLLARQELNADLETIADGQNRTDIVTNLIAWAERSGCVSDLIAGAVRQNPTNPELQALAEAARSWHIESPAPADKPPYKGLAYFDVADTALFYGRETLTAELVAYLKSNHFLAVVGASGSGKSSLVRAGLVAQLAKGEIIARSDGWTQFVITPTAAPLKSLAAALTRDTESVTAAATLMDDMIRDARSLDLYIEQRIKPTGAPRVLIVVDQFEELFTECKDPAQRKAFIDNLLTASALDGSAAVVLTLRADFYAHCAEYDNLRMALQDRQKYIGAMSAEELRAAVERPAADGGWMLEEGLANRLLKDIADEPGSLPLLSHVLFETWKRRSGRMLTFQGYEAAGGVRGAVAQTADSVFAELSPDEQATAQSVFLRLTSLGEDGVPDTRRRVSIRELVWLTDCETVLHKLENARLVTAERDVGGVLYYEVTHEALIREWPRLRLWLDENRIGIRIHRRLTLRITEDGVT